MNKYIYIAVAIIVGVAASFGLFKMREGKVLQVNQVGYSYKKHPGVITVAGIMVGTSDFDSSVFGIMDIAESKCKNGCEKLFIPVMYKGKHPAVGDEVKVKGSFEQNGGGIVFKAEKMTVVGHHELKVTQQASPPPPPRKWN